MFFATYKNTVKSLIRSPAFWAALAVVLIFMIYDGVFVSHYAVMDPETMETIEDTDPDFVLTHSQFTSLIPNVTHKGLLQAMSIFTAITAALILNRDYGDMFFEIEKSAGIKPKTYLFARLLALISLNAAVNLLLNTATVCLYAVTRGGVTDQGFLTTAADAFYRIIRMNFGYALPCIIFYVCFTYCVGSLLKSGYAGAGAGMGYAVAVFAILRFTSWRSKEVIHITERYLLPIPKHIFFYTSYLPGELSPEISQILKSHYEYTPAAAGIAFAVLITVSVVYAIISYLRVRTRNI